MRENDIKIAEWLGYRAIAGSIYTTDHDERGYYRAGALLDYTADDSAAITLLPVLVERGYQVDLHSYNGEWIFKILKQCQTLARGNFEIWGQRQTISIAQSISSATISLIEKEGV